MRSNLHFHSKFSDGKQWPEEMVVRAKVFGLELISLTDHDTMEGIPSFLDCCSLVGIKGIAGVEIDCMDSKINYNSEILGYFPNGYYERTRAFLLEQIKERQNKIERYLKISKDLFKRDDLYFDELKSFKIGFSNDRVNALQLSYTKVDLYQYLKYKQIIDADVGYGHFKKNYFSNGKPLYEPDKETKPLLKDIVELIRSDGGYAVLPHPGHIFGDDLGIILNEQMQVEKIFKYCSEIGIWGVEIYYYGEKKTTEINNLVRECAGKYNLKLTYGSDCHGRGSPKDNMEKFYGNFYGFS